MKKILITLALILLMAAPAAALCPADCELYWIPPTKYTDGQDIDAADLPLSYVVEWDGVILPATINDFLPLPKPYGHNIQHTARIKTITAQGTESVFSPPFDWNSPEGIPAAPGGLGIR